MRSAGAFLLLKGLCSDFLEHTIERVDDVLTAPVPSAPPVGWASGPLGAVQAADREIARQTALRARAVAQFAAARPASGD
ncbi:hypothetical protein LY71_117121, partial [Geodermatophilus tzadiensis]